MWFAALPATVGMRSRATTHTSLSITSMRHAQAVSTVLVLACQRPAGSFVPQPAQGFFNGDRKARAEHEPPLWAELQYLALKRRCVLRESAIYRHPSRNQEINHIIRARKAGSSGGHGQPAPERSVTPVTQSSQTDETVSIFSSDGVSCLLNADTGSRIVLVGVVHGKHRSVELAEKIVREVKPGIVMLELDGDRLEDLPPGRTHKTQDGLSWFTLDETPAERPSASAGGVPSTVPDTAKRRRPFSFVSAPVAKLLAKAVDALRSFFVEEKEHVSEMESAVWEAEACGARVCLGDRDFEETKRRLVEAGLADSVDDERLDDPEALLHSSMSASAKKKFASFDLKKPESRETARRYYAALDSVCDPKALSAMISERDEVMAKNLMALGGEQTTAVALLGIFHVDGIERILTTSGWQKLEQS